MTYQDLYKQKSYLRAQINNRKEQNKRMKIAIEENKIYIRKSVLKLKELNNVANS